MNATTLPAKVELSPEVLAAAFWSLNDTQQAQFFVELAKQDERYRRELQWHFLGRRLEEPGMDAARGELMSLAAPLYLHTLRFVEGR